MERTDNDHAEGNAAEAESPPREDAGMVKEHETKEDGRYIIFYSFGDEEDG